MKCEASLFDTHQKPNKILLELLDLLDIAHNGTLSHIVEVTQKKLLRPQGKERWELVDLWAERKSELLPLLRDLGLIDAQYAAKNNYTHALIMGGAYERSKNRLAFLVSEYKRGVYCEKIFILSGNRPLTADEKRCLTEEYGKEALSLTTEAEMLDYMYKSTEQLPVPIILVNVQRADGKRPTTNDTFYAWLECDPEPGSCLIVTSQSFIRYQDAVAKTLLPAHFVIETIGDAAPFTDSMAIHLDHLARWIYQEQQRLG